MFPVELTDVRNQIEEVTYQLSGPNRSSRVDQSYDCDDTFHESYAGLTIPKEWPQLGTLRPRYDHP